VRWVQLGQQGTRVHPRPQDRSPLVAGWQADSRLAVERAVLPVAAHIRRRTAEVQQRRWPRGSGSVGTPHLSTRPIDCFAAAYGNGNPRGGGDLARWGGGSVPDSRGSEEALGGNNFCAACGPNVGSRSAQCPSDPRKSVISGTMPLCPRISGQR